jgi:superfamily II DNA or RNA helicase
MTSRAPAIASSDNFITAQVWEKTYGEAYEKWRKDRWANSCLETRTFLEHVLPLGRVEGEKRLLPHQAEALQRIIYSFEHADLNPLMTTLATGTGKTVVMASVIAWLACRGDVVNTFLLFCPNTIVRDRLRRDFESLEVFKEFNLFPLAFQDKLRGLSCSVIEGFQNFTNLRGKNIVVANRHQFQKGYTGGNDHLAFLQREGGQIAVFNDEAHNTRGKEYTRTLAILKPQTTFRLDVTATPDRADNLRPQSHEVYNLSVVEAITGSYKNNRFIDPSFRDYPALIKDVVVQRPSIKTLEAIQLQDLIFRDARSNRTFTVREINWEEWPKKQNLQLVMDPGGMKMQLQLAFDALEKKRMLSKDRYKPLLFVIAPSIMGAQQAVEMMKKEFNLNPLLVVGDLEDMDVEITEKEELRNAAANLGDPKSTYDSVVSVYMLREGWDVPEVSVICLLRGFGSPLFAHQVLGRGLRLIRRNNLGTDRSVQELTVIDHPCLQLDDLWAEIDALVKEGDEVTRYREIPRDGTGVSNQDEEEKRPEQILVRPELYQLLQVPSPRAIQGITAERALEMLEQSLEKLKDYRTESAVIVGVEIDQIERLRPKREVETSSKSMKVSALPNTVQDREFAQKHFNKMLMEWAEDYADRYQPLVTHDDVIYRTLLKGFEKHIFLGQSITEVPVHVLFGAQNAIPQLREAVTYEMNYRVYAEEVLNNE